MTDTLALDLAGARLDLRLAHGSSPALERRYAAFACPAGPARWQLELRPGPSPALEAMTGRVTVRDGCLRLEGLEQHGSLDIATRRGEARLDPSLVVVDALVRAAMALDLSDRGGCLVHAAALVIDGQVHLAPGRSGSGKSTLASLAGDVLSDELCTLTPAGEAFRVAGTPWWKGRPGAAPLAALWTLAWDGERAEPLPRTQAFRHLCPNLVVPGVPRAQETAFQLCGRVAMAVPFGRLSFRRDTDVDALLRRRRDAA